MTIFVRSFDRISNTTTYVRLDRVVQAVTPREGAYESEETTLFLDDDPDGEQVVVKTTDWHDALDAAKNPTITLRWHDPELARTDHPLFAGSMSDAQTDMSGVERALLMLVDALASRPEPVETKPKPKPKQERKKKTPPEITIQ